MAPSHLGSSGWTGLASALEPGIIGHVVQSRYDSGRKFGKAVDLNFNAMVVIILVSVSGLL